MPISPQQVEDAAYDQQTVDKFIAKVDKNLSDPVYLKNNVCNSAKNPTYRMGFAGTLTKKEKEKLTELYLKAGWGVVEVSNSEDGGERPGMCGINLYKFPKE